MKALRIIMMSLLLIATGELMNLKKASAQGAVSFQVFYDQLGPYGRWVDYPQYGYVWIPAGAHGFIPYSTSGHWVFTDLGWTWVSDFAWGWAPFHYGRWLYDDFYGWVWVPGTEWGPAWVCWRHAPGYYGWTPMPPGVSINVMFGPRFTVHHDRWIFVRERYIAHPRLVEYIAPRNENVTIIKNSTVINNTYSDKGHHATYITGPRKDDVQRATGTSVKAVSLKESGKPEQSLNNNELKIYRPAVQKNDTSGSKPAPKKVEPFEKSQHSGTKNVPDQKADKPAAVPATNADRNDVKQQQVKPEPAPVKKQPEINREQPQQVKPKNTIDKSRQRPVEHQKRIVPVQPGNAHSEKRNDKPGK